MATRTGKVDAKDKPGPDDRWRPDRDPGPRHCLHPQGGHRPLGRLGHFVRQTLHAPAPGSVQDPGVRGEG